MNLMTKRQEAYRAIEIEVPGFPGQIIPPEARVWKVTGTKEASETLTDDGSAGKRREKNRARLT